MAKTRLLELATKMTDELRVRKQRLTIKNRRLARKSAILKKKLEEKKEQKK